MHFHCEIVMPPVDDIEAAVASIMAPFSECPEDGDDDSDTRNSFWDWYVIGGRWAGAKLMARYDKAKMDEFYAWLKAEGVTVSGVTCGKQTLRPASQIPKVDAKWAEMFPSDIAIPCPIFDHSSPKFADGLNGTLPGDVLPLAQVPEKLTCCRVIFAAPSYNDGAYTGPLKAEFMCSQEIWNGVNWLKTEWDGNFSTAVAMCVDRCARYLDEHRELVTPKDDWQVVTVDYHS